jgi:hypothetical protein
MRWGTTGPHRGHEDRHWRGRWSNPFWCRWRCCNGGRVRRQRRRGKGHRRRGRGRGGARVIRVAAAGGATACGTRREESSSMGICGLCGRGGLCGFTHFDPQMLCGLLCGFWEPAAVVGPAGWWRGPRRLQA